MNTPALRFPEFKEEWIPQKYSNIFSFRTTNSYSRENLNYNDGLVKNIHYGDIHTKFNTLFDISKEIVPFINSEINVKNIAVDNYCKEGDLLIADASEDYEDVGKCIEIVNLNGEKVLSGLHTILARPDLFKMSIGFNGYLMKSENIRLQIKTIAQGSKVLSISSKRLAEINLIVPQISEQEKIVSLFTSVDKKLTLLKQKQTFLEQYKKGVVQNIFSRRFRFTDDMGKEFPPWEKKKLEDVCEKIQDGNYGGDYPKSTDFIANGIPFLTSKAIGQDGQLIEDKIDYISLLKHNQLSKAHLKINDILFTNRGSNVGTIGLVTKKIAHGNIGPQLTLLRCKNGIYYLYLKEIMSSYIIQKQVSSQNSGSAMNFFGIGETCKFKIILPSLPEQTKIANFLSAIDEKINYCSTQIEKTALWKKGLLQKMFV